LTPTDAQHIAIVGETAFVLNAGGRILHVNEPTPTAGPRLWMAGCATNNMFLLHEDVSASTAAKVAELIQDEPPLVAVGASPRHLARYVALLGSEKETRGINYALPHDAPTACMAKRIWSDTAEGDELLAALNANGMPHGLYAMGFINTGEFWPPWCALLEDGVLVSICFAARLGKRGADAGVATAPAFRGKGYAAAVTAGWAAHPALAGHVLGYSTTAENLASQRVAARLGLRMIGATITLA
jgi:RimJ/RimL family protein N-acetyltransferase